MAILPILTAPDPVLKQVSKPVERVDDDLRKLMDDMLETMYDAPGIGLAAIQVGVPKRVLVMDVAERAAGEDDEADDSSAPKPVERNPRYFVNPEIIAASDDLSVYEEGCLSVPEQFAEVERPAKIRVRYMDYQGELREEEMEGLLATCLQHELDHLNGILFIDHLSNLKRRMILKKLQKAERQAAEA